MTDIKPGDMVTVPAGCYLWFYMTPTEAETNDQTVKLEPGTMVLVVCVPGSSRHYLGGLLDELFVISERSVGWVPRDSCVGITGA